MQRVQSECPPHRAVIFVIGAPDGDKCMLCQIFAEKFRFLHLSVPALLHADARCDTRRGAYVEELLQEGKAVPQVLGRH